MSVVHGAQVSRDLSTKSSSLVGPMYYLFIPVFLDFLLAEFLESWVTFWQAVCWKPSLLV